MDAKVVPLGARDVIPDERTIYELQLTYNFNVSKSTDITPNLALLSDVLYESEFESQLWMLYNSQKQLVACGDAYPSRWSVKVVKDDYVLKAHVRHEKKDVLDKNHGLATEFRRQAGLLCHSGLLPVLPAGFDWRQEE